MDIILASQSPRRKELLTRMGLSFRVVVSDIDEHMERSLPPDKLVESISAEKARAVQPLTAPDSLIVAADTVVVLDGTVLGKPADEADARRMLSLLSGREHQVYTGFTILQRDHIHSQSEETFVTFRPLTEEEIAAYVSSGEPLDKAGAYGIQGLGSMLVQGIRGDYFNVMGLPVCAFGQALEAFGLFPLLRRP